MVGRFDICPKLVHCDFADSANVYKLYQAVGRHITAHPEDSERFPNYTPIVPPVLVLGPHGPLQGGLHYAQKFHGK